MKANKGEVGYREKRVWGEFKIIAKGDGMLVKILKFKPNKQTSLQYHKYRKEVWYVIKGDGTAVLSEKFDKVNLIAGIKVEFGKETVHQIIAGVNGLEILEIWVGEVLDEEDIVRMAV